MRYRSAKSLDPTTMTTFRDLIPTKLAAGVWNSITKYKSTLPHFPQTETCELLIVDRSVDQVLVKFVSSILQVVLSISHFRVLLLYLPLFSRLLPLYTSGHMMQCAMIC